MHLARELPDFVADPEQNDDAGDGGDRQLTAAGIAPEVIAVGEDGERRAFEGERAEREAAREQALEHEGRRVGDQRRRSRGGQRVPLAEVERNDQAEARG